jgi:hypothetical protein
MVSSVASLPFSDSRPPDQILCITSRKTAINGTASPTMSTGKEWLGERVKHFPTGVTII